MPTHAVDLCEPPHAPAALPAPSPPADPALPLAAFSGVDFCDAVFADATRPARALPAGADHEQARTSRPGGRSAGRSAHTRAAAARPAPPAHVPGPRPAPATAAPAPVPVLAPVPVPVAVPVAVPPVPVPAPASDPAPAPPLPEARGCLYALSQPPLMIFLTVIAALLGITGFYDQFFL